MFHSMRPQEYHKSLMAINEWGKKRVVVVQHQMSYFSSISWREQVTFYENIIMSPLY